MKISESRVIIQNDQWTSAKWAILNLAKGHSRETFLYLQQNNVILGNVLEVQKTHKLCYLPILPINLIFSSLSMQFSKKIRFYYLESVARDFLQYWISRNKNIGLHSSVNQIKKACIFSPITQSQNLTGILIQTEFWQQRKETDTGRSLPKSLCPEQPAISVCPMMNFKQMKAVESGDLAFLCFKGGNISVAI